MRPRKVGAELAVQDGGLQQRPVVPPRGTGRQVSAVYGRAVVARAQVDADEYNAAFKAQTRLRNGRGLAETAVDENERIDQSIKERSTPETEDMLRGVM